MQCISDYNAQTKPRWQCTLRSSASIKKHWSWCHNQFGWKYTSRKLSWCRIDWFFTATITILNINQQEPVSTNLNARWSKWQTPWITMYSIFTALQSHACVAANINSSKSRTLFLHIHNYWSSFHGLALSVALFFNKRKFNLPSSKDFTFFRYDLEFHAEKKSTDWHADSSKNRRNSGRRRFTYLLPLLARSKTWKLKRPNKIACTLNILDSRPLKK